MRRDAAHTAAMLAQDAPGGKAKQATKDAPNLEPRCSLTGSQGRQSQGET